MSVPVGYDVPGRVPMSRSARDLREARIALADAALRKSRYAFDRRSLGWARDEAARVAHSFPSSHCG